MKTIRKFSVAILFLSIGMTCVALADHDEDEEEHGEHGGHEGQLSKRNLAVPLNPTYKAECASCHMLYPPGLLPARSWTKIMTGLKSHFGENAALDPKTTSTLTAFLVENAADHSSMRRPQKIAQTIGANSTPIRFTETNYFKGQHHEINGKIWERKSVGSKANCIACHSGAESGIFSEDQVRIPR